MNWTILKGIGEYIKNYTGGQAFGYFRLAIDILIILAAVIVIFRILMKIVIILPTANLTSNATLS